MDPAVKHAAQARVAWFREKLDIMFRDTDEDGQVVRFRQTPKAIHERRKRKRESRAHLRALQKQNKDNNGQTLHGWA